jgi:hypothetical protein
LQQPDGQIVKVDLQHLDALLFQPADQLVDRARQLDGLLGREGADEEWNFVAQTLHLQEPFAGDDRDEVLKTLLHRKRFGISGHDVGLVSWGAAMGKMAK